MSKPASLAIGIGLSVAAVVVLSATYYFGNLYLIRADVARGDAATCKHSFSNHLVIIKNDVARPDLTNAELCDTITFTNADNEIRLIAFGPHEHHVPYDGVTEKTLGPGQSFSIQLNQVGSYHFHDHIHDEVTGQFTVSLDTSRINF